LPPTLYGWGAFHDIRTNAGIAKSTFFVAIHRGIDAVNNCPELAIRFPTTTPGLQKLALDFQGKSSNGALDGCVGALDGWLCHIKVPIRNRTANVSAYFSGHYQCHGVNVQACCDSQCRFTWFSVRSPGGTGDSRAFYGSGLKGHLELIPRGPRGFYIVADSAYTLTTNLLTPFSGGEKKRRDNDVFNFHLSQLRIKIEQSFGLMVNKWRVLKKPIELRLERVPHLVECCMRLHNFCVDERVQEWCVVDLEADAILDHQASYEEYIDELDALDASGRAGGRINTRAKVRDVIRKQLTSLGRSRPSHNIRRNN
jgi:hypothetical protein